jgi:hypothetical protein
MAERASHPRPPTGYLPAEQYEYPKVKLQLGVLVVLAVGSLSLLRLTSLLQRQPLGAVIHIDGSAGLVVCAATALAATTTHELAHGLAFRVLGYRVTYKVSAHPLTAYVAALGQWQARDHAILAALAPVVVLTLLLVPLLALPGLAVVGSVALTLNMGGAVGDLYRVWRLLRLPRRTLLYHVDVTTMLMYVPALQVE